MCVRLQRVAQHADGAMTELKTAQTPKPTLKRHIRVPWQGCDQGKPSVARLCSIHRSRVNRRVNLSATITAGLFTMCLAMATLGAVGCDKSSVTAAPRASSVASEATTEAAAISAIASEDVQAPARDTNQAQVPAEERAAQGDSASDDGEQGLQGQGGSLQALRGDDDEAPQPGQAQVDSVQVDSIVQETSEPFDPTKVDDHPRTIDPDYAWLPPRTVQHEGPHKIGVTAMQAWVHLYPDDETAYLGYIRAGRVIDRSENWIAKTVRCPGGWYEVLPQGYLCNGNRATLNERDPIVIASWKEPKRGEGLPYFYARPNSPHTYLYFQLPSDKDQHRTEGAKLDEHLSSHPTARLPNVSVLGEPEPIPEFLAYGKTLPKPYGATKHLRYNVHEGTANPRAAFAFLSVHDHEGRLFGLTTELNLIPFDRMRIVKPPKKRGGVVEDLPAGIVRALSIPRYVTDGAGTFVKDGAFEQHAVLDLTGRTLQNYWELRDGSYITAGAVQMVEPRTSFPSFAEGERKWLDISIKNQTLVAYTGKKAVYVTVVSTGLGELADPAKSFATVRGAFTIKSKHLTAKMTGSRQADDYELADVPYVQYFHEGYALHGTFWHDNFGRVQSHGCVNLAPEDSAWVFGFTEPQVPEHWHGIVGDDKTRRTVVYVRP